MDIDANGGGGKPALVLRSQHNIGVAMDTPSGLVVPVIKSVNMRNVVSIASELVRLQALAQAGKLAPADLRAAPSPCPTIGNNRRHVPQPRDSRARGGHPRNRPHAHSAGVR